MTDQDLLQQFLATRDEQAFAELVRRYIGLVYASARRQIRDPAAAEDVTQSVFILLAQKARTIRNAASIPGWLLVTTRCVALNTLRAQIRRQRHESEAAAMKQESQTEVEPAWDSIGPLLDEAVATLRTDDRDALTLRYFRNQPLTDVASALGVSEPAARKRVQRAVERLRQFFASRGVVTSADALAALLPAHALTPGPAVAFTAQVSQVALSTSQSVALKGGIILMTLKAHLAITCAAVALTVGISGTLVYLVAQVGQPTVAGAPAVKPTSNPAESWRDRFNRIYSLNAGNAIKHVSAPFPQERIEYCREEKLDKLAPGRLPDMIVFETDGPVLQRLGMTFGERKLRSVLNPVAHLLPAQTNLTQEVLDMTVAGDWIVRKGATQTELVDGIFSELASIVGPGMTLKPNQVERDAIVVNDTSPTVSNNPSREIKTRFVRDVSRTPQSSGESHGNVPAMAMSLGECLQMPVVLDSDFKGLTATWRFEPSADFRHSANPPDPAIVDEILATVSKQTSLQFKRERRMVTLWELEPK